MKDIAGYTDEEAKRFAAILVQMGIPTFGPSTGLELLRIVEALGQFTLKNKAKLTPDMIELISGYRQRIRDVCAITVHMQGEVLRQLDRLVKK